MWNTGISSVCVQGSGFTGELGGLAAPRRVREVTLMINPLGRSVLGGALVPHRLELGRTGTAVGELGGGQGLPLPLPDSWELGECREGFLFGHPPCMIFTVFVSRDFSSMDVS